MSKFKFGDKVKVRGGESRRAFQGKVAIITEVLSGEYKILFEHSITYGTQNRKDWIGHDDTLELVEVLDSPLYKALS